MNGLAIFVAFFGLFLLSFAEQNEPFLPQLYIKRVDLSKLPEVHVELGNVTCPPETFYGVLAALQFFTFNAVDHFEFYGNLTCPEVADSSDVLIKILIDNPDLAYFPVEKVIYIGEAVTYAWIADYENTGWADAKVNAYLNIKFPDPLSRPKQRGRNFYTKMPKLECEVEQETFDVIKFPVVLKNTGRSGVVVSFSNFSSPEIEGECAFDPRLSILTTIYLVDNCLSPNFSGYCSIFHAVRGETDDETTPQLFLAQFTNEIVIQVADAEDLTAVFSYRSGIFLKTGHAYQILLSLNIYAYDITVVSWDPELLFNGQKIETREGLFDQRAHLTSLSWPRGYFVFGGSDSFKSFEGFIDSATVFRTRFTYSGETDVISRRKLSDLGQLLALRLKYCDVVKVEITTCQKPSYLLAKNKKEIDGKNVSSEEIYQKAFSSLEKGENSDKIFEKLSLAGCLGSGAAEFLTGVLRKTSILSSGKGELPYLVSYLKASLHGDHFADLALGFYLMTKLKDHIVAFRYLNSAAYMSQKLTALHSSSDRWVDSIHLNNREELETHQDNDDGPVIAWLMYQAGMGDTLAMHDVARLFYLGAQGVDRDMARAANLFRQAAHADADPEILYDYGIVLLHGRGVEANRTLALEYLKRSADAGYGPAYGAIGWYYMEKDGGNLSLAVPYLEKAAELNVPEAAHNIGWLLLNNRHPFKPGRHPGLAYGYFMKAAGLGSLEGALMTSDLAARGIPSIDLNPNATEACRYSNAVATQSPRLGKPLRAALSSYLAGNMRKSFIHYAIAAETGNDVAIFNTGYLCETEAAALLESGAIPHEAYAKNCMKSMYETVTSRPFIRVESGPSHALLWLARAAAEESDYEASANFYADALLAGADEGYYGLSWLAADRGVHIPVYVFEKLIVSDDKSLAQHLASLDPIDVALFLLDACMTVEQKEDDELVDEDGHLSMNGKMKALPEGYFSCALYKFYIKANLTLCELIDLLNDGEGHWVDFWSSFYATTVFFVVGFIFGVLCIFPLIAFISSKLASIFRT